MDSFWENYTNNVYPLNNKRRLELEIKYLKKNFGKFLPANKNIPILDFGFGRGAFLLFLKRNNYRNFLGIEIGKKQVDFVKNITPNVLLVKDSLDFLARNKNQFGVIFMSDVLAHLPRDQTADYLKALYCSLKDKGLILIRTPSVTNPFCLKLVSSDFTVSNYYSYESANQILNIAGFKKIRIKEENFNFCLRGFIYQLTISFINFLLRPIIKLYNRTDNLTLTKMMIIKAEK